MNTKAKRHFQKVDPVLFRAIERVGELEEIVPREPKDYFSSLCRDIISQQLAGAAANAILGRFHGLFPRKKPSVKHLSTLSTEELRAIGMSWAKARYIKDAGQKLESGELRLSHLQQLGDTEAIAELTKIKGVGQWTAEMFLMFSLGREDIFSFGDLGLRKGMQELYGMREFSQKKAEFIVARWSPYRTFASRILWKIKDAR
ncbi:MAG: DNA-3-methyladenine glycosylase 2 family protein [bacterium]|nr:DNA-3-methyladenine glycosylase 2 family protein [bacterium]